MLELIDTLWNVNVSELVKGLEDTLELIDTLWNVNRNDKSGGSDRAGINRYIMECKSIWLTAGTLE